MQKAKEMIIVIEEAVDSGVPGVGERNANIQGQAARDTMLFGAIVTTTQQIAQALETGDQRLVLYAHGNGKSVGRFNDMGALAGHLRDLGVFATRGQNGKSITAIWINSCHSSDLTGGLAAAIIPHVDAYLPISVKGYMGRTFTDLTGASRVAKSDELADEVDQCLKNENPNSERFTSLLDTHCHGPNEKTIEYTVYGTGYGPDSGAFETSRT